jgi:LacI family transcriptional regulator
VDVSTVSRVLNNDTSRGVSESKRRAVIKVARKLGYQPHRSARALRMGRHFNVAYALTEFSMARSDLEMPFARFRLYGMEEVLSGRGYLLSLLRLNVDDPGSLREKVLRLRHVDGLVFSYRAPSTEVMSLVKEAQLPAVVMDSDVFEQSQRTINCVLSDRALGIYESIRHLVGQGHRRIAFISAATNYQRYEGYFRALESHGLERDERLIKSWVDGTGILSTGRLKGYQATQELLAEKVPFTAIQAGSDFTAAGAIDALREAGVRVPEDVVVVGFDDVDSHKASPFPEPFLTTVYDPNFEMGQKSAELLLAQIEEGAEAQRVVLPTRLVVRESCGARLAKR